MAEGSLHGRVAIVTGGGRGMGRAIANAFAAEGADVAIIDRMSEHFEQVTGEIEGHGRRAAALEADLTDVARISGAIDEIRSQLGDLDILANNAGVSRDAPAVETTEEIWDANMDVNAKALFFCAQAAGRYFIARGKGGKIINTASTYALTVEPGLSAYCASKGAVLQITRALAAEWAQHGINVNAVGPTMIHTEMVDELFSDAEYLAEFMRKIPATSLPAPTDVADAVVFLAGPRSDHIHGHMLAVDSGELAV